MLNNPPNGNLNYQLKRIVKRKDFPTVVLLGDSITNQNGSFNAVGANNYWQTIGFFTWVQLRANGHFDVLNNAGIGGNTTAQMLARLQTDVIAYRPDWCVIEGGINDVYNAGPILAATTIANLTTIYDTLRSSGIKIIITTVTPSSSANTADELLRLGTINEFILKYALDNEDVILVDWYQCLADTDGKTINATFSGDGTHPNVVGAWRMGKKMFECLDNVFHFSNNNLLGKTESQSNNLLVNGVLVGDTLGKADGWTFAGSTDRTYTKEYYDNGYESWNEQCVDSTAANTISMSQAITTGFSVGEIVEALARIRFENVTAITSVTVQIAGGGYNSKCVTGTDLTSALILADAVFRTPRFLIPTGTTTLTFYVTLAGFIGKVKISNPTVRKIPN